MKERKFLLYIFPLFLTGCGVVCGCVEPIIVEIIRGQKIITIPLENVDSKIPFYKYDTFDNCNHDLLEGHVIIDPNNPLHGKYSTTLKIVRKRNGMIIDELELNNPAMVRDISNSNNLKSCNWRFANIVTEELMIFSTRRKL